MSESISKIKQAAAYYDDMFTAGGDGGVYDLPYRYSSYYPLFRAVLRQVRRAETRSVLEVGCGTGGFAHLLSDKTDIAYAGFDFSAVAVTKARSRTGRDDWFFLGDALSPRSYTHPYDTIVCTEVLEHISDDLGVIEQWRRGAICICSVPNFDAESHERFFKDEEQVRKRYGRHIEITRVARIKKPILPDISWINYVRAIRWYRYRPKMLLAALGIGSFTALGGWFLFTGRRR